MSHGPLHGPSHIGVCPTCYPSPLYKWERELAILLRRDDDRVSPKLRNLVNYALDEARSEIKHLVDPGPELES